MHFMHLLWLFGKYIGLFHGPAVIVTTVMTALSVVLLVFFFKIFEKELFGSSDSE
jgi:hypothetical protein